MRVSLSLAELTWILGAVALLGCGQERPPLGTSICEDWKADIAPLLERRCGSCHGGRDPAGGLDLTDYQQAIRLDGPRLSAIESDPDHADVPALKARIVRWSGDCSGPFLGSSIHAPGVMRVDDPNFHGTLIRESGYDFAACGECHGTDFRGGGAEASCYDCHERGPTDCTTCHGAEITSGLHPVHLNGGPLGRPTPCETCHVVPDDPFAPGHFLAADGTVDPPPVEVVLTGSAAWGAPGPGAPTATGEPSYDPATMQCDNVYCHGGVLDDPAAVLAAPRWEPVGGLDCTSCHGDPPSDHASDRCGDCHPVTAPAPRVLVEDPVAHLDGRWSFVAEDDRCDTCHGATESGIPPPDLDGVGERRVPSVGAHQPHAQPRLSLSGPVPCEECHLVPDAVDSPGHIDSDRPAEVFPEGAGQVARAGGSIPSYDPDTSTCGDTWCHGNGTLDWTGFATGQVYCGSCHAVPPTSRPHFPELRLSDCARCHVRTVDPFGNIIVVDGQSAHMNGEIEFDTGGGP